MQQRYGLMCASSLAVQPTHTLSFSLLPTQEYNKTLKYNLGHAYINQVLGADTQARSDKSRLG